MTKIKLVSALIAALTISTMPAIALADNQINKTYHYDWIVYGKNQVKATVSDKKVKGGKTLRITMPAVTESVGDATLQSIITGNAKAGDVVQGTVWLRCEKAPDGGPCKALLKLKQVQKPYKNYFEQVVEVGSDWKEYSFDYVAAEDFPGGSINLTVQVSYGQQVIDVAQGAVFNRGPKAN